MFVAVHKDKHYVGGSSHGKEFIVTKGYHIPYSFMGYLSGVLYVIVIPWYKYDIVVITRVQGEAKYEC